jgi:hypothetical protein
MLCVPMNSAWAHITGASYYGLAPNNLNDFFRRDRIRSPWSHGGEVRDKRDRNGGRYWIRTSDLFRVKEAIYH